MIPGAARLLVRLTTFHTGFSQRLYSKTRCVWLTVSRSSKSMLMCEVVRSAISCSIFMYLFFDFVCPPALVRSSVSSMNSSSSSKSSSLMFKSSSASAASLEVVLLKLRKKSSKAAGDDQLCSDDAIETALCTCLRLVVDNGLVSKKRHCSLRLD